VAVLVDIEDPDWQETCLRIIEHFSSAWGGEYHIIVPTDGTSLSVHSWEILEAFDPDYIFFYGKSGMDLKLSNIQQFEERVERTVRKFIEVNHAAIEEPTRHRIVEMYEQQRSDAFGISPTLQKELKTWLAPFHFREGVVEGELRADSVARYPLIAVHKVLPFCDHPKQLITPRVSLPGVPEIWLNCITGRYSPSYRKTIEELGLTVTDSVYAEGQEATLFETFVNMQSPPSSPFSTSMTEMAYYRSYRAQDWDEPAIVVIGNHLKDFCLYHGLSRLRYRVSWLLPWWLEAFEIGRDRANSGGPKLTGAELLSTHFAHALLRSTRSGGSERQIIFLSETVGAVDLQKMIQVLDEALLMGEGYIASRSRVQESIGDLLRAPKTVYEKENAGRPRSYQFIDHLIAGFIETPKPAHLRSLIPGEHRWITEFAVKEQAYPRHPALGEFVVKGVTEGKGARSGRNGIAYDCPNWMTFGTDIDAILVKPRVFLPDALETIEFVALQQGLYCRSSDKGHYLSETIRKFGDLRSLGQFLRDTKRHELLNKYLDQTRPAEGVHDEGVLLSSDNRRYLDFRSIEKIFGSRQVVKEVLDFMVSRSILQRGLILKCELCRGADWFSMEELADEFCCKRCAHRQVISSRHWREPEEPAWFYKLDEIAYLAHYNNLAVSALALHYMEQHKVESFMYTTDLEFSETQDGRPEMEIDFCCIQDGQLFIGEAKKEDQLGENAVGDLRIAERYLKLANRMGIANVLFATIAPGWSARTVTEIERAFSGTRIRHCLLQGPDLLG